MKYRKLGRTGMMVSEIGLGCEHLEGMAPADVERVVRRALDHGINFLDVFMPEPHVRTDIGKALAGRRHDVILQGHIGPIWQQGQYARTRDVTQCRAFVEDFLHRYDTDYIDIGMIHFVDSEIDLRAVFESELIDYVQQLRDHGVIRAVGLSSHEPVVARMAVETGLVDVLMFSLNPAFDLLPAEISLDDQLSGKRSNEQHLTGMSSERQQLLESCAMNDVAITVMKAFAGGTLLNAELSPLGVTLTPVQCVHYALTRPAVASALIGCRSEAEVDEAVAYGEATASERDFAETLSQTDGYSRQARCMYCNHCLPCPSQINIAAVLKYLDLAEVARKSQIGAAVPATVQEHYSSLSKQADACTACGQCEPRCPFAVPIIARMELAQRMFA